MIKKIGNYVLLAAVALPTASCPDKLPGDEVPFDNAIRSMSDVNQVVIDIYDAFKSSTLYSGNLTLLPDLQTGFVYTVNGYANTYGNIWRWEDILAASIDIEAVYQALYAVINRCNFILDRVDYVGKSTTVDVDLDKLDQYCSGAYFTRTLACPELIKLFCKAYESDEEAANELGVILTEYYNGNEGVKRASLRDSYQLVLDDLNRTTDLLKLKDNFKGTPYDTTYFDEYTVYALRARIALYMKKWDDAIEHSDKVIENNYRTLTSCTRQVSQDVDYYQYMWTNDHPIEGAWKVDFTVNSYGGRLDTIFASYGFHNFRSDHVPAEWIIDLYDSNDLHVSSFFKAYATGYSYGLTWPLLMKYFGNQDSMKQYNILHITIPKVFRLSEQYPTRAEAYVQKDQPNYAKADSNISAIRIARYSSYGGSTAINKEDAMDIIGTEHVKELYMEDFHLQDLKRWRKKFKRKPQGRSLTNGSSLKVRKDDPLFVWPIPQHGLDSPGSQIEPSESNK